MHESCDCHLLAVFGGGMYAAKLAHCCRVAARWAFPGNTSGLLGYRPIGSQGRGAESQIRPNVSCRPECWQLQQMQILHAFATLSMGCSVAARLVLRRSAGMPAAPSSVLNGATMWRCLGSSERALWSLLAVQKCWCATLHCAHLLACLLLDRVAHVHSGDGMRAGSGA